MAIENPDKIGWTGKIWTEPKLSGYDKNNRGYGIDIEKNDSAKQLTEGRTGRWLTDSEMNQLMDEHISYVYDVAKKHINNFDSMSPERLAALLGMLYRGDSVNKNLKFINLKEFDDKKFYDSISNYYRNKGLNERANNSDKFFADKINRVEPKFSITEPLDNTRVNKMEFIPAIKRKIVPKPIPWGGPEPQTFGGYTPYMKNGNKIHIKKYQNPSGPLKPAQVYLNGKWVDLESHGDGNLSAGGRLFKVKTKPTSATGNKEVVITPRGATSLSMTKDEGYKSEYRSAYHPEDAISFINTLTLGGLNNLSPTLWARRAYDTGNLLLGGMNWSNYTNSWINGNNGVVSNEFAKKHSTLSNTLNGAIDITTLSLPFNSTFSKLWNNGKIIQNKMPYNPNNFYREVGKNAIKDAKMSGVIRTGNKGRYMGPFFGKGSTPWQKENYIIEGTPESSNWIYANPYENYILCMKDNPELCSGILESKPPILPVESTSNIGAEVFPYYNNLVAFQPLNEGFTYWKKHPIIGWRQHNFKQGGKMFKFKKGNKIHIKKANRGKFTDYCGGKVTNACIQKAKASGNPTLVKRATFALNARKWKHSEGGNLHKWSSNFGRTIDSNPNLDNMKGDYVSKKKSKYLEGGNIVDNFRKNYPTASKVALFIPFIGTALDGYDVIAKGDYSKTPEFLIGLAGDLTGYGAISKALKARKAYKALLTTKLINPSSVSMPVLKQAMLGTNKATTRAISATTTDVLGHAFNFKNGGRI